MTNLPQALPPTTVGTLQVADGQAQQAFLLPEDFLGFAGHFPGRPLLPAFVQLYMGRWVIEQWQGEPLPLQSVERAKFFAPIGPGQLTVRCKATVAGYLVHLENEAGLASQFLISAEMHEFGAAGA